MSKVPQEWEILNTVPGGEVIDTRNIAQRIEDLDDEHTDSEGDVMPVEAWPQVAREERQALKQLLSDVSGNLPNGWNLSSGGDCLMLVHPDYLPDYIKQYYDDTYGGDLHTKDRYGQEVRLSWSDLMDREPFKYISWEKATEDWQDRCPEIEYHGQTYYLDF